MMEAGVEAIAAFVHTSEVAMTVADPDQPDCPVVSSNAAFQELTGYSHAMIEGKNCRFLQGEATDQIERAKIRKAVRDLRPCVASLLNFKADGEVFHNLLIMEPLKLKAGRTLMIGCQFGFDLDVDRSSISLGAVSRYSEIDRIQRQANGGLSNDVRVALHLRADAAIMSVRNYQIKSDANQNWR